MSDLELQEEEREVLLSIYDGDDAFKEISPTVFQYKFGVNDDPKSFLLEISWGPNYPTEKPTICMDKFYNKHIVADVKQHVVSVVNDEAEQYLTMAMTYSLFEFVKEKFDEILAAQPDTTDIVTSTEKMVISETQDSELLKKTEKKEQLSKSQKRKQWDRVDSKGDKPRGYDWVDIVKHLSQSGYKHGDDLPST